MRFDALTTISLCLGLGFTQARCVGYLWHVSSGQLSIICQRQKISSLLTERNIDLETRVKLKLVLHIQKVAGDELGLSPGKSYTYYTRLNRDYVAYNVSATPAISFEPYTWYFPITGSLPYKGYFDKKKAENEAQCLAEKGYDSKASRVSAYSTLGWFDDPVLSPFLAMKDASLAGLLFHEMAHATFYLKSQTRFNESFASFVEEKATQYYLEKYYGQHEAALYLSDLKDYKLFIQHMVETAEQLDSVYNSTRSRAEKLREKSQVIAHCKQQGLSLSFHNPGYRSFFKKELNNSHFASIQRYHSGFSFFEKMYLQKQKNLRAMITHLNEMNQNEVLKKFHEAK